MRTTEAFTARVQDRTIALLQVLFFPLAAVSAKAILNLLFRYIDKPLLVCALEEL